MVNEEPRMLVIVPTRGRPENMHRLEQARRATCTTGRVEFLYAVDDDDPMAMEYARTAVAWEDGPDSKVFIAPRERMVGTLNTCARLALKDSDRWAYLGFMGDDHLPRTTGWDAAVLEALDSPAPRIVYGNDLLQGPNLPTAVFLQSHLVRALGFMAPPVLQHLYADNFWLELGRATGGLVYLDGTVIEHVHPIAGKTAWDAGYQEVNSRDVDTRDRTAWLDWSAREFPLAMARVRQAYGMEEVA